MNTSPRFGDVSPLALYAAAPLTSPPLVSLAPPEKNFLWALMYKSLYNFSTFK